MSSSFRSLSAGQRLVGALIAFVAFFIVRVILGLLRSADVTSVIYWPVLLLGLVLLAGTLFLLISALVKATMPKSRKVDPFLQGASAGSWQPAPATTKRCPACAEQIQAAALLCRYCGTRLDTTPN